MIATILGLLTGSKRPWLLYAAAISLIGALAWGGWALWSARSDAASLREELAAQRVLTAEAQALVATLDAALARMAMDAANDSAASAERARTVLRTPARKPSTTNLTEVNKWLSEPF